MGETEAVRAGQPLRLTTVVAADVCGYSRLAEANQAAAIRTVSAVFQVFERICASRRGRIFHRAGDGFIAEFPSAADGVLAALEFTNEIGRRDTLAPNSLPAKVRAGVHVGDVAEQPDGDLLGHGVNIAARLQSEAAPGGVLVSLHSVNLVRGKIDARFHRRGPLALKNINEPVVAFDVIEGGGQGARFPSALQFWRKAPRYFLPGAGLIAALALVNIIVLMTYFDGQAREAVAALQSEASERVAAEVNAVTRFIIDQQPDYANEIQVAAVSDALRGLVSSPHIEKQQALAQIKAGRVSDAARRLESFQRKQRLSGAPVAERIRTLKELAVLIYYEEPARAREIYSEILALTDNSDVDSLLAISDLLIADGKADAAHANFETLIRVSRISGDEKLLANALIGRGRAKNMLGRLDDAREDFETAQAIAEPNGWPRITARSLMFLGSNAYLKEDLKASAEFMRRALAVEEAMTPAERNEHFIAETRFSLGTVLMDQNKLDEAETEYKKALLLAERHNDKRNVAIALYNLGDLKLLKGEVVKARKDLTRARDIARSEPGTVNLLIHIHVSLATAEKMSGDIAAACAQVRNAQNLYVNSAHPIDEVEQLGNELGCA